MSTRPPTHGNGAPRSGVVAPPHPRPSERTELVRAAADGELTAAQDRSLRDHLAARPEDRAVIAFEQKLRRAVATIATGAPSRALLETIERMVGAEETAPPSDPPNGTRASLSPWKSRGARWLAAAASIGLVTVAAYLVIRPAPSLPPPGQHIAASHRVALASFVGQQHKECELHAGMIATHFRITSLDRVPAALSEVLGTAPDLGRIAASGLIFKGAGTCAVPGRGRSIHMVFEANPLTQDAGALPVLVSIFVQQDRGELRLEPGRTYRLVPKDQTPSHADIFVWRADNFVYFLASTSKSAMDVARLALGADVPSGDL